MSGFLDAALEEQERRTKTREAKLVLPASGAVTVTWTDATGQTGDYTLQVMGVVFNGWDYWDYLVHDVAERGFDHLDAWLEDHDHCKVTSVSLQSGGGLNA